MYKNKSVLYFLGRARSVLLVGLLYVAPRVGLSRKRSHLRLIVEQVGLRSLAATYISINYINYRPAAITWVDWSAAAAAHAHDGGAGVGFNVEGRCLSIDRYSVQIELILRISKSCQYGTQTH